MLSCCYHRRKKKKAKTATKKHPASTPVVIIRELTFSKYVESSCCLHSKGERKKIPAEVCPHYKSLKISVQTDQERTV